MKLDYIMIEPSASRNLKCSFCGSHNENSEMFSDRKGFIDDNHYNTILSNLEDLEQPTNVLLQGFGEPLLHPNIDVMLYDLIKHKKVNDISITTNGTKMSENFLNVVKNSDKNIYVRFSLFGLKKQHEEISNVENYDILLNNLTKIYEIMKHNKSIKLEIETTIDKQTDEEINSFVDFIFTKFPKIGVLKIKSVFDVFEEGNVRVYDFKIKDNKIMKVKSEHIEYKNRKLSKCSYFNKMLGFGAKGNINLCCIDWLGVDKIQYENRNFQEIFGDIEYKKILSIHNDNDKNVGLSCHNCDRFYIYNKVKSTKEIIKKNIEIECFTDHLRIRKI